MGLLGGISLLLMQRLPQDLVTQHWFGADVGLAQVQLVWLVLGISDHLGRRDRRPLRQLAASLQVHVGGGRRRAAAADVHPGLGGERPAPDPAIGPFSGQPSEFLKVILVVFLAGYLSENRSLLMEQDTRVGPLRLPPLPYLAPMVVMWAIALGIVVIQRDLGAALLFFGVFLALVYVATSRVSLVVIGLVLFVLGSAADGEPVRSRPRPDRHLARSVRRPARAPATRWSRACTPSRAAGCVGVGLGSGLPTIGGRMPIPEVHTDFPLAALGEELGLIGVLAILGLYLVLVERGLRIGAAAADDFRALLAVGLALVIGIQAFIIAAGNLKVLPLTGVTLPFISYGGSSILANSIVVGLLLALSDKGVEPPPVPTRTRPLAAAPPTGSRSDVRPRQRPPATRRSDRPGRHRPVAGLRDAGPRGGLLGRRPGARTDPVAERRRRHRRGADRARAAGSSIATAGSSRSTRRTRTASSIASTPARRSARSSATPRRATAGRASSARSTPSCPAWPAIRCGTRSASSARTRSTRRT